MRFPDDVPTLTDGVVTLRAHRPDDEDGILEQCQDLETRRRTTVPVPYTRDDARRLARVTVPGGWTQDQGWAFAVQAADDRGAPRFGGTVSLRAEGDRRAELAYGAHPWLRGRGHMVRAVDLLLDWGFAERHLRTVIWWADRGNWASRRVAWRLGFDVLPGVVRTWLPQRGDLRDAWVGTLQAGDSREPRHQWYDVPRIVGRSVVLRPHQRDDAARVQAACADERTAAWLADLPQPYTLQHAVEFLQSRAEAHARGTGLHWAVADPGTDLLVGNISLFDVKAGDDAEIGYWTHPDARGRGVMTQACGLVVRHAFLPEEDGGLGLRRLKIFAAEGNTASRHVIEANGFVQTGRHRADTRLAGGLWVDTIAYDLLAEEYVGPRGPLTDRR